MNTATRANRALTPRKRSRITSVLSALVMASSLGPFSCEVLGWPTSIEYDWLAGEPSRRPSDHRTEHREGTFMKENPHASHEHQHAFAAFNALEREGLAVV